jgi:hypothetical protein
MVEVTTLLDKLIMIAKLLPPEMPEGEHRYEMNVIPEWWH